MREGRKNPLCAQCTLCALIFVQAIDLAELCYNSQAHHAFAVERRFPELTANDRGVAGLGESGRSPESIIRGGQRLHPQLSLLAKSRFPATETADSISDRLFRLDAGFADHVAPAQRLFLDESARLRRRAAAGADAQRRKALT